MENMEEAVPEFFPLRVSTGINHVDVIEVVTYLRGILGYIDTNNPFTICFEALERAAKSFCNPYNTKKHKEKMRILLEKAITSWNRQISLERNRKSVIAEKLPAINTKERKQHGHVKELPADYDSLDMGEAEGVQCVVCSHKTKSHNWPCCVMPQGTLSDYLSSVFGDPSLWGLEFPICKSPQDHYDTQNGDCMHSICIQKSMFLKCQMKKTSHCKNQDEGAICGSHIKFRKLWVMLRTEDRQNYTSEKIRDLYFKVLLRVEPSKIVFCKNPHCEFASKGFIARQPRHTLFNDIECKYCDFGGKHDVHGHRQTCPSTTCGTTFCQICGITPYHFDQVCQGPRDDEGMDDKTYALLIQQTKKCPHCSLRTEKLEGCDKMHCQKCSKNWCWRCCQPLHEGQNAYHHRCLPEGVIAGVPNGAYYQDLRIDDNGNVRILDD